MRKTFWFFWVFILLGNESLAQDPHFSQFFSSPLTLNPALTGKFDGDFRAAANYRNQWPTFNNVYRTYTGSIDFRIMKNHIPETDTWGVGILGLSDKAGDGILTNNYLAVSTSYHKSLDEDGFQQIGIGFQGTYGSKRLDNSKLFFEDMLTPFGFTGVTNEVFMNENLNVQYFDLNAGLLYSGSTTGDNNFYGGFSIYHINQPKESFLDASWAISPRLAVHGGGYFPIGEGLKFHASGIAQFQNKASEVVIGGAVAATVNDDATYPTSVYLGSWYRVNDALIPYFALEFEGMRIGATYDINISSLHGASQSRGGLEVSIIYIHRANEGGRGIPCPVF